MLDALVGRWRGSRREVAAAVERGESLARAASAAARSLRMAIQVAMLATGATLAIDHQVTGGTICAAAILLGRVLFPFEQLIDGWRQWVGARGAWRRLKGIIAANEAEPRSSVPMPIAAGAGVVADRVGFAPVGAARPVLRGVSFAVAAGEVLGVIGPSGAGSRRWRGCFAASGVRARAPSCSTGRRCRAASRPASAARWVTCRRTLACSMAPCGRTSPAFCRMPTRPMSWPLPGPPGCMS